MKLYKITKPHHAIDPRYDGEQVLCSNPENEQEFKFLPWFSARNEVNYQTIDECRKRLAHMTGIDDLRVFIKHADRGDKYEAWTYDTERTTIDGEETYHNGLTWLANIEEA